MYHLVCFPILYFERLQTFFEAMFPLFLFGNVSDYLEVIQIQESVYNFNKVVIFSPSP